MLYLLLALVALLVALGAVLVLRRSPDAVDEVERFTRAREMTTRWSNQGWDGPPPQPGRDRRCRRRRPGRRRALTPRPARPGRTRR